MAQPVNFAKLVPPHHIHYHHHASNSWSFAQMCSCFLSFGFGNSGLSGWRRSLGSSWQTEKPLIGFTNRTALHVPAMSHLTGGNSFCICVKSDGWTRHSECRPKLQSLQFLNDNQHPSNPPFQSKNQNISLGSNPSRRLILHIYTVWIYQDCSNYLWFWRLHVMNNQQIIISVHREHPETPAGVPICTDSTINTVGNCQIISVSIQTFTTATVGRFKIVLNNTSWEYQANKATSAFSASWTALNMTVNPEQWENAMTQSAKNNKKEISQSNQEACVVLVCVYVCCWDDILV